MKYNYPILTMLFILFTGIDGYSQDTIADMPRKYLYPVDTITRPYPNEAVCKNTIWLVYSDRTDNPVYKAASDTSEKVFIADFMEKFEVYLLEGEWLLIGHSKPIGWIKFNKLLLSSHCLLTENLQQYSKGFVLNTLSDKVKADANIYYYKQPSLDDSTKIGKAESFQVMYLFKTDTVIDFDTISKGFPPNVILDTSYYYLVGKQQIIHGAYYPEYDTALDKHTLIKGWIPGDQFIQWNNNVAWELNWHPDAVRARAWEDRKDNVDKGSIIFKTVDAANSYGKRYPQLFYSMKKRVIVETDDIYHSRKGGLVNRFPLIYNNNDSACSPDSAKKVGIIVKFGLEKEFISEADWPEMKVFKEETLKIENGQKKTNVLFVIDATQSAITYKASVLKSLESSIEQMKMEESNRGDTISIGCVLFRDESEDNICDVFNDGKLLDIDIISGPGYIYDSLENEGKLNRFSNWLSENWIPEKNQNDTDQSEALFYGMSQAIDKYQPSEYESNFMVIIGDAGDHREKGETYIDKVTLIDKLAKHKFNILAYQIHIDEDVAYENFVSQLQEIIIKTDSTVYKNIIGKKSNEKEMKVLFGKIIKIGDTILLSKDCMLNSRILTLGNKNISDSLRNETIIKDISQSISSPVYLNINSNINSIAESLAKTFKIPISDASSTAFIIYKKLKEGNAATTLYIPQKYIYTTGFTPFVNKELNPGYPLFQPVVLIKEGQLTKLIDQFNKLNKEYPSGKQLRNDVADAVLIMLKTFLGEYRGDILNAEIGQLLYCQFMFKINAKYEHWTINKIKDAAAGIPLDDIKAMKADLIKTSNTLTKIQEVIEKSNNIEQSVYRAKIHHFGEDDRKSVFLWIPCDVFPHQAKKDDVNRFWF